MRLRRQAPSDEDIPDKDFLRAVLRGKVRRTFTDSPRRGPVHGFRGDELMALAHERAGYISIPFAGLRTSDPAFLTEKGRAVLESGETAVPPKEAL